MDKKKIVRRFFIEEFGILPNTLEEAYLRAVLTNPEYKNNLYKYFYSILSGIGRISKGFLYYNREGIDFRVDLTQDTYVLYSYEDSSWKYFAEYNHLEDSLRQESSIRQVKTA